MLTKEALNELRNKLPQLEAQVRSIKETLSRNESSCQHRWGPTIQGHTTVVEFVNGRPIHRGSDFWYESVPVDRTVPMWTRTCNVCGKVEQTTQTKDVVSKAPNF